MAVKKPWASEYKVMGIPNSLKPYPEKPAYDLLYRAAKKFKNMGFVQMGYEISYPEVRKQVDSLANALISIGIKRGDRIATLLPTSIQFAISDYAISRSGAAQIPSSHLEPADVLEYKFKEGSPKVLISLDKYIDQALKLKEKTGIEYLILTNINDYSSEPSGNHENIDGAVWLTDLIKEYSPNPLHIDHDIDNDIETLLFTGGTTGMPKGCMLTHKNIYSNAIQNSYALGASSKMMDGAISVLLGIPFFHSYGHCVLHSLTYMGHRMLLAPDPRDTKSMIKMIKKYYPLLQFGVPTQFLKLLEEELEGTGIIAISGSAALPKSTQDEFEKKSGGGIMEGYGLSEMSPVTHFNNSLMLRIMGGRNVVRLNNMFLGLPGIIPFFNFILRRIGSDKLGKAAQKILPMLMKSSGKKSSRKSIEKRGTIGLPFPDTEIKIIDIDNGAEFTWDEIVKEGKTGELCLSGPQRMLGYWPDKGSGMDQGGFIHTGDVVRVDENGFFYIVDRTKDMIIISGYKVYSREIDDLLYKHPAVEMAATVGVPDPKVDGSERVVVYVQIDKGYKGKIKEEEIIDFLRDKVAKYAVPKRVVFIDEMPLTEVQKVNKKAIRELANKEIKLD